MTDSTGVEETQMVLIRGECLEAISHAEDEQIRQFAACFQLVTALMMM